MATPFNTKFPCPLCNRYHAIRQCSRFLVQPCDEKLRIVARLSLCYNCLAQSHARAKCSSFDRCRRCQQDHNSWLHPLPAGKVWLQMTARVRLSIGPNKGLKTSRALLDPTASRSTISQQEASALQCVVRNRRTKVAIFHANGNQRLFVDLVVEGKAYSKSPSADVEAAFRIERGDGSADPRWNRSLEYGIVLGADVMNKILIGPAMGKPGLLLVQDTIFGFAYFGEGWAQE